MAIYATRTDFAQHGLTAKYLNGIGAEKQDAALAAASGEADTYLGAVFTLPLISWAPILTQKVCHLAAWQLMTSEGFNPAGGIDQAVLTRYEQAISWFKMIAADRGSLEAVDSSTPPEEREGGITVITNPRRGWRRF